ncbi:MAG: ATP synthase F1 subunit gamma [Patescibacteria group bacterium]|nr:ATP synthase F1 subunit gamma [Patescibacteria group bacterium]MDD5716119.1 ATP synthase F1 subunit gamma [Patescibacteria group bacterium]
MSLGTREIKRRIRSIANTKKITKAMELVAAAKMRKAVNAVLATRAYSKAAWGIVQDLSAKIDPAHHALLQKHDSVRKIGAVLLASNRGLCGGFNREIVDTLADHLKREQKAYPDAQVEVLLMGRRGSDIAHKHHYPLVADFEKADVAESVSEVNTIAQMVIADYLNGKYDKVVIAYTDYRSAISQQPRVRQLLPIVREDTELGLVGPDSEAVQHDDTKDYEYLFEPSPDAVLEQMLYRLIELQVYQALLESNASEHSARMMSMRNASDAAGDMITDLTLTFNQARQQAITAELADISAGSAAIN